MSRKTFVARDVQPTVLRLHPAVREELMRLATINGRSLSREIAIRLDESLSRNVNTQGSIPQSYPDATPLPPSYKETNRVTVNYAAPPGQSAGEPDRPEALSSADRAILEVFRRMPAEK